MHNTNEKKYPISDIQFTNLDFLLCGKNQSKLWIFFIIWNWDLEKTPGMSSFVTIGHELWIILTVRTTYHFLVCSTFHRSIMKDTNTTVGYPYTYHYCTYVQCFFLLSCDISLLHTRHYICLKRVHTIELLLSGRILISNGYL